MPQKIVHSTHTFTGVHLWFNVPCLTYKENSFEVMKLYSKKLLQMKQKLKPLKIISST